jgi:hypothetical protein
MRQPLTPAPLREFTRQRDSGYLSIEPEYPGRKVRDPRVAAPMVNEIKKNMQSPFFHGKAARPVHTPVASRSIDAPQHEQLASGLHRMRMESSHDSPPISQSLNTLSFIEEPYTNRNQPVFTRSASHTLFSRQLQYQAKVFDPRTDKQSYLPEPRHTASRVIATASTMQPARQSFSRRGENIHFDTFRGSKGAMMPPPLPSRSGASRSRFPYQQQRTIYTANVRRSVRR